MLGHGRIRTIHVRNFVFCTRVATLCDFETMLPALLDLYRCSRKARVKVVLNCAKKSVMLQERQPKQIYFCSSQVKMVTR